MKICGFGLCSVLVKTPWIVLMYSRYCTDLWATHCALGVPHGLSLDSFSLIFFTWSEKFLSLFDLFHIHLSLSISPARLGNGPKWVSPDQKLYFYPQWPLRPQSRRHSGRHAVRTRAAEWRSSVGTRSWQPPPHTPTLMGSFAILMQLPKPTTPVDTRLAGVFFFFNKSPARKLLRNKLFSSESFILREHKEPGESWLTLKICFLLLLKSLWESILSYHCSEKQTFGPLLDFFFFLSPLKGNNWSANRTLKGPSQRLSPLCENSAEACEELWLRRRNRPGRGERSRAVYFCSARRRFEFLMFLPPKDQTPDPLRRCEPAFWGVAALSWC